MQDFGSGDGGSNPPGGIRTGNSIPSALFYRYPALMLFLK
jgi:hypothetical protein